MAVMTTEQELDSLNSTSPIAHRENALICELPDNPGITFKRNSSKRLMTFCILLAIGGITCGIVGVVFFEKAKHLSDTDAVVMPSAKLDTESTAKPQAIEPCGLSREVQDSGLLKFFDKVEEAYFAHNPHDLPYKYRVSRDEVIEKFQTYNPRPASIKAITDEAKQLLQELNNMKIQTELLKPREAKTLAQTKHFLEQNFGNAYDNGYYTGEWMLGPSRFCYMQTFVRIPYTLRAYFAKVMPTTLEDVERVMEILQNCRGGINQYRANLELGVRVGMVNSIDEWRVGYDCLAGTFPHISRYLDSGSIEGEQFVRAVSDRRLYFKNASEPWQRKYGKPLSISWKDAVLNNLGEPLAELFRYLLVEHRSHCVPGNVSSGLATRPVSYVYTDGVANMSQPTTKTLPTGEKANGRKGYERILKFFTTTNATPDEVYALGWKTLNSLYPQVIKIAKLLTNEANESRAVEAFRTYINSSEMYFNKEPFPANESNELAHTLCKQLSAAKIYCPVRYATLQKWFTYAQSALSMLQPRMLQMFYWLVGPKKTTPVCPISMTANFQPSSGSQGYASYSPSCRVPGAYFLPFFLDRMGPKYSEWSVNAHEAMPGHHLQTQGERENFKDMCKPLLGALLRARYSYTAFIEGWAMYAEYPLIAKDTSTYDGFPLQEYGMLKWQIWRALRLIVDTGLHYKGMTRKQALQLFSQYAWDDSDVAEKEVTRYQSGPGQATAYMIGQRAIISMRKTATKKLGKNFNLKDFHYHILSRGPGPINFVKYQIDRYIDCEINRNGQGCENTLVDEKAAMSKAAPTEADSLMLDESLDPPIIHEQ